MSNNNNLNNPIEKFKNNNIILNEKIVSNKNLINNNASKKVFFNINTFKNNLTNKKKRTKINLKRKKKIIKTKDKTEKKISRFFITRTKMTQSTTNTNNVFLILKQKSFKSKIVIRFTKNNIFATFKSETNRILRSKSAGACHLNTSYKMRKYIWNKFINIFLRSIVRFKKDLLSFTIKIIAKKNYKRKIFQKFKSCCQKNSVLYILPEKKCFNGCRANKKRRRKRIRSRIYKL